MVDLTRPPAVLSSLPFLLLTLVISLWSATPSDAEVLNDYILDYQFLTFNHEHLKEKHERVKRYADPYLRWNFRAYGRTFNLQLEPAKSVFGRGHHLVVGNAREDNVDTSHIYEGKLAGDPRSLVHMSIHNGSVLGFINIPGHTIYHMEPAEKYIKDAQFPSIIYPESRMNLDPYRHKRAAHASNDGSCFNKNLYTKLQRMSQPVDGTSKRRKKRDLSEYEMQNPYAKYTSGLNEDDAVLHRHKRALYADQKTCFMSIRADKILYDHLKDKESGTDKEKAKKAKEALLSMFAIHISALNLIYEPTVFKFKNSDDPKFRGVRFQLQRSTIITECGGNSSWPSGYCTDNLDVSNFLDLTSLENHDNFCLVHTFTYRDFVGGTLGLAWVANPESRAAGVCGIYGRVSDNGKITTKSLNTGITTLINFNREVASRVSQLTFAHEVGHNFGAEHDTTTECAPYGSSRSDASLGNYIMYPSANTGNLDHNDEFSVCSKDYIAKVLNTMGSPGGRVYCFKDSNVAFCGNKVVEGDEECDCGYQDECDDGCCHARADTGKTNTTTMCTRKSTAVCSPTQGPCCTSSCAFAVTGKCLEATDCTEESFCGPGNATCPEPTYKDDISTYCDDHDRVCIGGQCIGSVCQVIGWTECYMKEEDVSKKEEMCYVSCQKDVSSECISSFDTEKLQQAEFSDFKGLLEDIRQGKGESIDQLGVKRRTGSTCNYGKGYCDVFYKCRNYDAEGPFKQLTDLIFDEVTFDNIEEWIVDHWWAVLLMCVGLVVFMAVFVKLFGYNTPSEDPKKKRRAQPMPRVNPNADKRSANQHLRGGAGASKQGNRGAAYATDVPMHDSNPHPYGARGQLNQGYDSYQDYTPYHVPQQGHHHGGSSHGGGGGNRAPHQQFDRIAPPRRY